MHWTLEHFRPHVGTAFVAPFDNGMNVDLILVAAEPLSAVRHRADMRPPFKLTFHNRGPLGLVQSTYRLMHSSLGAIDIFLTPVGRLPDGGSVHEAFFN